MGLTQEQVAALTAEIHGQLGDVAATAPPGETIVFNIEGVQGIIRTRVMVEADAADERTLAAFNVMSTIKSQRDAASSQAEIDALDEHYTDAETRYNAEVERVIQENGLEPIVEAISSAVLTDDPDAVAAGKGGEPAENARDESRAKDETTVELPDVGNFLEWVQKAQEAGEKAHNDPEAPVAAFRQAMVEGVTPHNMGAVREVLAAQERLFQSWWQWIPTWNNRVCRFNPAGRKFKRKQLRNMGTQFTSDVVLGNDSHRTADELLALAELMESVGRGV
jgi:hypothetical protein